MALWTVAALQTGLDTEPTLSALGLLGLAALAVGAMLLVRRTTGERATPSATAETASTDLAAGASPTPDLRPDGGKVDEGEIEMVVAYIRTEKLDAVKAALVEVGAPSLSVSTVSGRGSQPAKTGQWRGEEYTVDLHRKAKVECVVADTPTEAVVDAIVDAAYTGEKGDGKVFVLPVESAVQIRTGKTGPDAV